MAEKRRTNAEIRAEICREDKRKDVHIHLGVFIATLSGISAAGALLATLAVAFLQHFRTDVEDRWMSVLPFVFTAITGTAVAYRKQLGNVGLHMAMLAATGLAGGFGYYQAVEPIYFDSKNCTTQSTDVGACDREMLVMIYVVAGGVACGFAAFGMLISCCACSKASKNRARREYEEMMRAQQEHAEKNKKVKQVKQGYAPPRPSIAAPAFTVTNTTPVPVKVNGNATNGSATITAAANDSTHL